MSALASALVLGQLLVFAPSGYTASLGADDRTETRLRTTGAPGATAVDIETVPTLTLTFNGRRSDFTFAVGPRIAYLDIENEQQFVLQTSARAAFGWSATRRLRLTLGGEGSVGRQSSAGLAAAQDLGAPTPQAQTIVAPANVINTLTYRASVGEAYQHSRQVTSQVSFAYGGSRGLDDESRILVPENRGPSVEAGVTTNVTRQDQLTTRARGNYTTAPTTGATFGTVDVMELYAHVWSRRTTSGVGAGVAWFFSQPTEDADRASHVSPVGEANTTYAVPVARGEVLSFTGTTGFTVVFDPVLASASPQLTAAFSSAFTTPRYGLTATVGAIDTVPLDPGVSSARQYNGSLVGTYTPEQFVRFELGARAFLQDLPPPPGSTIPRASPFDNVQWALFAAVVFTAPATDL